jgi:hypothetical protein
MSFTTPITVDGDTRTGPLRSPVQMLAEQEYGGHASVHDDETAATLGLRGAPIEGPTHFSQIDPLAVAVWGRRWFEDGCLSAHFQTMVVEGEEVRARLTRLDAESARIECLKADGTPVLTGTAGVGRAGTTELDERRARLADDPGELHIIDRLEVGMTGGPPVDAAIDFDGTNGLLYPFTLAQKLSKITESCSWYLPGGDSPWDRPILPTEMISVLAHKEGSGFPVRGPSVGLFVDLEVRYVEGPVFVDTAYCVDHRIVAIGQSRRVESYWTESRLVDLDTGRHAATVLLHQGVFKDSYAGYPGSERPGTRSTG